MSHAAGLARIIGAVFRCQRRDTCLQVKYNMGYFSHSIYFLQLHRFYAIAFFVFLCFQFHTCYFSFEINLKTAEKSKRFSHRRVWSTSPFYSFFISIILFKAEYYKENSLSNKVLHFSIVFCKYSSCNI